MWEWQVQSREGEERETERGGGEGERERERDSGRLGMGHVWWRFMTGAFKPKYVPWVMIWLGLAWSRRTYLDFGLKLQYVGACHKEKVLANQHVK